MLTSQNYVPSQDNSEPSLALYSGHFWPLRLCFRPVWHFHTTFPHAILLGNHLWSCANPKQLSTDPLKCVLCASLPVSADYPFVNYLARVQPFWSLSSTCTQTLATSTHPESCPSILSFVLNIYGLLNHLGSQLSDSPTSWSTPSFSGHLHLFALQNSGLFQQESPGNLRKSSDHLPSLLVTFRITLWSLSGLRYSVLQHSLFPTSWLLWLHSQSHPDP